MATMARCVPDWVRDMTGLPLSGLKVLDITVARAGPTCVRHLADWGADIIRIEAPLRPGEEDMFGDRDGSDYQNLHRNKRMVQLNLKVPEGREAFLKLAAQADVVVENMRVAVKHRLGVAYEDVRKVNPRIVYGSISGFGQEGPYSERAGVDQIVQGMAGLMSVTGKPGDGPMRVGIAIADSTAGNILALGIMMALFERQKTGVGRWVHTSLLEAQIMMMDFQAARWLVHKDVPRQAGNDHPTGIPNGVYETADGLINMSAVGGRLWLRFCEMMDDPMWAANAEWQTTRGRSKHRVAINEAINQVTRQKPSAHWIALFNDAGIPCGPINAVDEVFNDPQVKASGIMLPIEHPKHGATHLVASALNFSGSGKRDSTPAPPRGAQTEEVLREAGFSADALVQLKATGAI